MKYIAMVAAVLALQGGNTGFVISLSIKEPTSFNLACAGFSVAVFVVGVIFFGAMVRRETDND